MYEYYTFGQEEIEILWSKLPATDFELPSKVDSKSDRRSIVLLLIYAWYCRVIMISLLKHEWNCWRTK